MPKFVEVVEVYFNYIEINNKCKKSTRDGYDMDLRLFSNFMARQLQCEQKAIELDQIERIYIMQFLFERLQKHSNSSATCARKLNCLRSFFKFALEKEFIAKDPTEKIDYFPSDENEIERPTREEVDRLLKAVLTSGSLNMDRDFAILKLILNAELKVSELINLNKEDINYEEKSITTRYEEGEFITYSVANDVFEAIQKYLITRENLWSEDRKNKNALFLTNRKNRLGHRIVQLMVKKYAAEAKLDSAKITPEKLRFAYRPIKKQLS